MVVCCAGVDGLQERVLDRPFQSDPLAVRIDEGRAVFLVEGSRWPAVEEIEDAFAGTA
jgi:hypothetical protein